MIIESPRRIAVSSNSIFVIHLCISGCPEQTMVVQTFAKVNLNLRTFESLPCTFEHVVVNVCIHYVDQTALKSFVNLNEYFIESTESLVRILTITVSGILACHHVKVGNLIEIVCQTLVSLSSIRIDIVCICLGNTLVNSFNIEHLNESSSPACTSLSVVVDAAILDARLKRNLVTSLCLERNCKINRSLVYKSLVCTGSQSS